MRLTCLFMSCVKYRHRKDCQREIGKKRQNLCKAKLFLALSSVLAHTLKTLLPETRLDLLRLGVGEDLTNDNDATWRPGASLPTRTPQP